MFKIYLCGYINKNQLDKCIAWRKKVREHYDNWKGKGKYPIVWLDPLNGRNLEALSSGLNESDIPNRAFMLRDYHSVKNANLIVSNLDTFGEARPSIGTVYELAWAWEDHKPVVVIGTDKHYIEYSFIKETAAIIFPTIEKMLESKIINYYFKGYASAQD